MNINFEWVLTGLVLVTGMISLTDRLCLVKRRRAIGKASPSWLVEQARGFFPVLLFVLLFRSFLFQPYRVPTGSLEPTILPGDFMVVSQYAYGLRLPIVHTKLLALGQPKRGDIVLFRWPKDRTIIYVKRLIGLPGDKIEYRHKQLYINGVLQAQMPLGTAIDQEAAKAPVSVLVKQEVLAGVAHKVFIRPGYQPILDDFTIIVPPGHYFMMGDNRDNSYDSRYWGFVAEDDLIGQAKLLWMSWDANKHRIRWARIGKTIE